MYEVLLVKIWAMASPRRRVATSFGVKAACYASEQRHCGLKRLTVDGSRERDRESRKLRVGTGHSSHPSFSGCFWRQSDATAPMNRLPRRRHSHI